jgi:hypothetical protein
MPLGFSFRRRRIKKPPRPDKEHLRIELNEAISNLMNFTDHLREELEISRSEEDRLNPVKEKE